MIFGHNFEASVIVISYIQDKKYYKWLEHFLKSYRMNLNHSSMYLKKYLQFDYLEKIHFLKKLFFCKCNNNAISKKRNKK